MRKHPDSLARSKPASRRVARGVWAALWLALVPSAGFADPRLSSLKVTGPSTVAEGGKASYAATAGFADGSTKVVTTTARWSENSTYTTISSGVLTAAQVPADQGVTVTASYRAGGVTRSAALSVKVLDASAPPPPTGSHASRFTAYEGTKTCLGCHLDEAYDVHGSLHYQWTGDAPAVLGSNGEPMGKLGGINDYCIYPDNNWVGKLANASGQSVDGGCARCHAGLGAKPEPVASQAQLENIDCLLCHSAVYKRKLETVDGVLRFTPDTAAMGVSALQAAVDITKPDDRRCLNCHGRSGGGDNYKRGDLEMAHAAATSDLDIHSARGVRCLSCHQVQNHRFAGRGVDLRGTDSAAAVRCENCHAAAPHETARLNEHSAGRVACTTCHIPRFAKTAPTDVERDWSKPGVLVPSNGLYEPNIRFDALISPEYAWWNGQSTFYRFGTPAVAGPTGRVLMAGPAGGVNEAGSKLYAFKHHLGNQPADALTQVLLPLKIGIFFSKGDIQTAIQQGATEVFGAYNGHTFTKTERWQGLFHEVAPKDQALGCAECHGGTRMNFGALGYTPNSTRGGKPLCASCHGDKSGEWSPSELFTKVHAKHVDEKHLDCANCHGFTRVGG